MDPVCPADASGARSAEVRVPWRSPARALSRGELLLPLLLLLPPVAILAAGLLDGNRGRAARISGSLIILVSALGTWRSAVLCSRPGQPARRAWGWVGLGCLVQVLVSAGYAVSDVLAPGHAHQVVTTLYGVRALLAPALLAAVMSFPAPVLHRRELTMLVLDMLMVTGSCLLGCWYFIVGPVLVHGGIGGPEVIAVATAVADCTLISGAAFVLMRGVDMSARRPVRLLLTAVACLVVPDLVIADRVAQGLVGPDLGGLVALVAAGSYLLALAVWSQPSGHAAGQLSAASAASPASAASRASRAARLPVEATTPQMALLPCAAALIGLVPLVAAAAHSAFYPWGGLAAGTVLMIVIVVAHQLLAIDTNRRLAVSDHVTGLANRAALTRGLLRAQEQAARTHTAAAVLLFDLDGFKQINDTLGHDAGDEALTWFALLLRRNVLGKDVVARLGGDEFAVVLTQVRGPQDAIVVAERILSDLHEPVTLGCGQVILQASAGIALTTGPTRSPAAILREADLAMYQAKRVPTSSWHLAG